MSSQSVGLALIVKDESAVIERCLASVRPFIDTWTVVDTGSQDDTVARIHAALTGLPGKLFQRPWVDFGHNRSELLDLAKGASDYVLLIDADMTVHGDPSVLSSLRADSYYVAHAGNPTYWNRRIVRTDLPWRYVGETHEYLTCDAPFDEDRLSGLDVVHHADGGSRADKYERDLRLLTKAVTRDPDDPRSWFYLAQTLQNLGRPHEAVAAYERRATLAGFDEEVYYAHYQAGLLKADELDDWPGGLSSLLTAWELRPTRLEALHGAVKRLNERRQFRTALALATAGRDTAVPQDLLFVSPIVHEVLLPIEWSVSAYWTGDATGCIRACDALLRRTDLSREHRELVTSNRQFGITSLMTR